jgi:putative ABC transport system ATP-binding protein
MTDQKNQINPAVKLELKNVSKSFPTGTGGRLEVLKDVSLTLESGDVLRLAGASGSGKTTFMNIVSALIQPDSGSVLFNGTDVTRLGESGKDRYRAENVGYIFQTFNLLSPYSVIENVYAPLAFAGKLGDDYRSRAMEALGRVGMADFADKLPYHLSVGQRQRVAVARVLFARQRLILADEPTASLDSRSSGVVREVLGELSGQGAILIFSSHDTAFETFRTTRTFDLETGRSS